MSIPAPPWDGLREDISEGAKVVFCMSEDDDTITYRMRGPDGREYIKTYSKES